MRNFVVGNRKATEATRLSSGDAHVNEKQGERFFASSREHISHNNFQHKIACLLEEGRTAEAIFLANFASSHSRRARLGKANFDPNQPRDWRGWWADGASGSASSSIHEVQYQGHFHDAVVEDLINGLSGHGSIAFSHVPVTGINGVTAIPDGASLPFGWKKPYFIEVKTGGDPPFTPNQMQVYPLICQGGHAVSTDPRIAQLGLTPGATLPPMDIMVVHTLGPGLPMNFFSYCKMIGVGGFK